jgi:thioredoxin-like negative regulator of GroEL
LPELEKLAPSYQGRVEFLAVSLNADRPRIRTAAQRLHLSALPLAAAESELLAPLGLETVPATFLVDRNGMMVARFDGAISLSTLTRKLDALVASPAVTSR